MSAPRPNQTADEYVLDADEFRATLERELGTTIPDGIGAILISGFGLIAVLVLMWLLGLGIGDCPRC